MLESIVYVCENRVQASLRVALIRAEQTQDIVAWCITKNGLYEYVLATCEGIIDTIPDGNWVFRPCGSIILQIPMRSVHPHGLYWVDGLGYSPLKQDTKQRPTQFALVSYEAVTNAHPFWVWWEKLV